jgi:hypothetical protein
VDSNADGKFDAFGDQNCNNFAKNALKCHANSDISWNQRVVMKK